MTDKTLIERLRRREYYRTEWHEPQGEIDVPVPADMAEWDDVESRPLNPDGPEAADTIEAQASQIASLTAALRAYEQGHTMACKIMSIDADLSSTPTDNDKGED